MASYKLSDIVAAAEAKYGSTDIEIDGQVVKLVNPLRLSEEKRAALQQIQDRLDDKGEGADSEVVVIRDAIRTIAEHDWQADLLINTVGDDLAVLVEIFESYSKGTQAGEASASAA